MALLPLLSAQSGLWLIAASAIGFDLGIQVALIAHQSIVYGIDPAARSRLNAVLMVSVFIGMAAGGALGLSLIHILARRAGSACRHRARCACRFRR